MTDSELELHKIEFGVRPMPVAEFKRRIDWPMELEYAVHPKASFANPLTWQITR